MPGLPPRRTGVIVELLQQRLERLALIEENKRKKAKREQEEKARAQKTAEMILQGEKDLLPEQLYLPNPVGRGNSNTKKARKWTPELILDRIREWNELYAEPPANTDWHLANLRQQGDHRRIERYLIPNGHWPCANCVRNHFGTFNKAIEQAGLTPRYKSSGTRRR